MIPPLAELLVAQEVTGAFVCGTTGEGSSLTTAERMEIAAAWVNAAGERLKVIVHVGHNSSAESVQMARHAASIGAHATATIAPSFFRPASLEALIETCRPIAAAAPNIPFYYYHLPSLLQPRSRAAPFAAARVARFSD